MTSGFPSKSALWVHILRIFAGERQIRDGKRPDLCVCAVSGAPWVTGGENMTRVVALGWKSAFEIKDSVQFRRWACYATQCLLFER